MRRLRIITIVFSVLMALTIPVTNILRIKDIIENDFIYVQIGFAIWGPGLLYVYYKSAYLKKKGEISNGNRLGLFAIVIASVVISGFLNKAVWDYIK